MVSYHCKSQCHVCLTDVLILVVVDNGLVLLNKLVMTLSYVRLNPYCSGRWSRTEILSDESMELLTVLILIVVDNGLVLLLLVPALV